MPCVSWLSTIFLGLCLLCALCADAAEPGEDPFPKSVDVGGVVLYSSGEGTLERGEIDDQVGWTVSRGSILYGDVKPVNSAHLRLEITLHDGGFRGKIYLPYDSTDESVLTEARVPGAWKSSAITLEGKNAWTTASVEWMDAKLAKRCNGHDFRLELPRTGNVMVSAIRVTALPPVAAVVQPVRIPLSPVQLTGVVADGDIIRLPGRFTQDGDHPIVINAADASELSMTNGKSLGADGAPAGHRYIQFVEQARYRFTVVTPGAYQLWERAYFPVKGYWNHTEDIDNVQQNPSIIDSANTLDAGRWQWVKAGHYTLTAGEHTFSLSYHGGARLDRLVFSRDLDTPPVADGGAPSRNIAPSTGAFETADAQPMDVANWLQLAGDADARGGEIRSELSTDGGAHWSAAPAERTLNALTVLGGGKDRLRARVSFTAAPDGCSPIVQGLAATYQPGAHNQIALANAELAIAFGPVGVCKLRAPRLGTDFLFGGQEAPLFQLLVKPRGSSVRSWISVTQAAVLAREIQGQTLTQHFRFPAGIDVVTTVTLDGATSRWGIDIQNHSTLEVCAAQYPMLRGVRVGESCADDTLIIPSFWRQLVRNPVEWNAQGIRELAMHWSYLYDETAGLYLADQNWPVNDLTIIPTRNDPTTLNYGLSREFLVAPGQQRNSPDYIVAVRPGGDWHAGADIYRAFLQAHLAPSQHPAWTRRVDGWCVCPSNDLPRDGYTAIAGEHDRALTRGIGFYMGGNRAQIDGPCEYVGMWPTYCPAYGNLREFQDVLREVRERGGHTNWYFNWQLLSPSRVIDRQTIAGVIPRAWVEHPVNWPTKDWYRQTVLGGSNGADVNLGNDEDEISQCVGSTAWQRHHHDRTKDWVAIYGADGMYYDQLSCINNQCSDLAHGHDDYGIWTRATADNLSGLTAEMRQLNSHFVTSGEGCNDVIGQAVTFHMTSGVWNRLEIFRYCAPEQILLDGGWNGGAWQGDQRWRFIWMNGARFEGLPDTPFCNQLLALRRKVSQLIYTAQFQDTTGLTLTQGGKTLANPPRAIPSGVEIAPVDGPQAKWYLLTAPSRGALINVIQDPPAAGEAPELTISVPCATFGPVKAAWALHLDGTVTKIGGQEAAGRYTFALPATEKATTVLLVNQVGPQVLSLELPFAAAAGSTMHGTLTVTHYGTATVRGTLNWQTPKGWSGNHADFDIAPGETRQVPVSLSLPAGATPNRYDLTLVTEAEGATATYPHWVSATDALWIRLFRQADGMVLATIFNRSDQPRSGAISFTAPSGITLDFPRQPFTVEPWGQTAVRVKVTGLEPLQAPAHLLATASAGAVTAQRSLMLYVPAPNGEFEADAGGEGHPDWWYCWGDVANNGTGLTKNCSRNAVLDTNNPYTGKTCVRLDPNPEAGKQVYLQPIVSALAGGHRYRLRVAVRKTDDDDALYIRCGGKLLTGGVAGKWTVLETTFDQPPTAGSIDIILGNRSRHPVWFDALSITPVE